jgi:CSLREA domain-containing protein
MKSALSSRVIILFAAIFFWANPSHAQGIIYVTSLEDKIGGTGGCSLKEAIYSANFDDNVAISE